MIDTVQSILHGLRREIWIITSQSGDRRGGLVATFVNPASIAAETPRLLIGLACAHHTHELVEESQAFAAHLVHPDQIDWVWDFGMQSGRDEDKFADLAVSQGKTGSPILTESLSWLDCRVEASFETGDRTLYLAEIVAASAAKTDETPLSFHDAIRLASDDRRAELKRQVTQDGQRDAAAIRAFREARK